MKKITRIISSLLTLLAAVTLAGCHDVPQYADAPRGNFEQLWKILDEHYCFFSQKQVDWDEIHTRYGSKISPSMSEEELFGVCAAMLDGGATIPRTIRPVSSRNTISTSTTARSEGSPTECSRRISAICTTPASPTA